VKNGVGRQHAGFTPWFWSYRLAAKIEAVVVVCVIAGVIAILALLFRMPGPLVVHLQDEKKDPIMGARVRCTSPDGQTSHAGSTDVFGEAKWPGLARGPWTCEVTPPDRFHAPVQTGVVVVVPQPASSSRSCARKANRGRKSPYALSVEATPGSHGRASSTASPRSSCRTASRAGWASFIRSLPATVPSRRRGWSALPRRAARS